MSLKSASRKLPGPGAIPSVTFHGGSSDSFPSRMQRPAVNFGPVATLLTVLVLSCAIAPCRAQTNKIFQWQFAGNSLSQSLPSCRNFSINVKPFNPANDTHGVAPFYMIAFGVNSTPVTTLIGTSENQLSWQVTQPIGTQLLLQVVDSQGSSGGVPPNLFTVTPGQTTNCIPPASTDPPFTVTANVTDALTTCQPWGLTIKGGTPPYNVSFAALNSPIVTNVTMGPNDDTFTFIDRADPGTQLIAAISDLNGRWASGTPIVKTQGSTNVDCVGLVSSSGNSTQIKEQEKAALATSKSRKNAATIAGVVVTLLVLLLLGAAVIFLYLRRRKMQTVREVTPRQSEGGKAPQAFEETGGQILSINTFISPASAPQSILPQSPGASTFSNSLSPSNTSAVTPASFDRRRFAGADGSLASVASSGLNVRNPDRPAFTSFPTASVRRSAKELEATSNSHHSDYSGDECDVSSRPFVGRSQSVMPSTGTSDVRYPRRSASVGGSGANQEVIYQHQDAGLVRELPPPYADQRSREIC
ncbi:hypothetical protein C8R43DRAFT_345930 [Mycena crocata]|nr:hypothetical protein C8R43DRAFT_345930 [Mycena crocata]